MTRPRKRPAPEPVRRWTWLPYTNLIVYAPDAVTAMRRFADWNRERRDPAIVYLDNIREAEPLDPCGGYFDGREGGT